MLGTVDGVEHRRKDLVTVAQDVERLPSVAGTPITPSTTTDRRPVSSRSTRGRSPRSRATARAWPTRVHVALERLFGVGLGVLDLLRVPRLRHAGAHGFELRGDGRAEEHGDRREQRPEQQGDDPGERLRTCRRTTCSRGRTGRAATVTIVHSSTETVAPNASHDHPGWSATRRPPEQQRHGGHHQHQRERPSRDRPRCRTPTLSSRPSPIARPNASAVNACIAEHADRHARGRGRGRTSATRAGPSRCRRAGSALARTGP